MDTGLGNFTPLSETKAKELIKKEVNVFREGEEVILKGSTFIIKDIRKNKIILVLR